METVYFSTYAFPQKSPASPLYISLAWSLVSLYFWFMTGKSSWVHSRTQGSIPLVVDGQMFYGYCSTCFYPVWW
jgi:hypothetical protein